MNKFRKIIVWILCISFLISIFGTAAYSAFGADSEDFDKDYDSADATLQYPYYEFGNITDIHKNDDYIVVTEVVGAGTEKEYTQYVVFETNGDFCHTFKMTDGIGDVQKFQMYNNTGITLNYLSNDTSMLYSNMLINYALSNVGDYAAMLTEDGAPIMRDFTVIDDTLYFIKVATKDSIKSMRLSGGKTVAQVIGAETDVNINLSGYSALESCGDDLIIEIEYSDLYHFDTETEKTTKLKSLPSEEILQIGGYNNHVFVLTNKGIYYCDIDKDDDLELILPVTDGASTLSNIVDPVAFSTYIEGKTVKMLIADNNNAKAVKEFTLSDNSLLSGKFAIYSFSSSKDGYNTPTDVSASYKSSVITDSENKRIKVIDEHGDVEIFYPTDEDGDSIIPEFAGIDYQNNMYIFSTRDDLYIYTSSGKLVQVFEKFEDVNFRSIKGMDVSPFDNTCYFFFGSTVYSYNMTSGEMKKLVEETVSGSGMAIDYYNNYVGIYDTNSMDVYSLATGKHIYSANKLNTNGNLQDVQFDIEGNFYALCSSDRESVVSKYVIANKDSDNYVKGEITYERVLALIYDDEDNANFSNMSINFENKMTYFLKDNEHRVYETDDLFKDLSVAYNLELEIPSDIFKHEEVKEVTILNVLQNGNKLLLPVSQDDNNYPDGYAIIRPVKLADNTKVIVTGSTDNGDIYYVLYNNSVGFMYASALEQNEDEAELPFEDALTLHDNTYIYKYPLSTTSDMIPLYGFDQLEKNTPIQIINLANDYLCPMGMLWYRVEADVNGDKIVGYMPRYNVVQNATETDSTYEYGRINAKLFEGYAIVYADEGITELGTRIYDGEKVEIMAERGDYYYVREVDTAGDVPVEGYILKEVVTSDAQTRSFTIAVILIIVLVIVLAIIIIIKLQINKRKRI